MQTRALVSFLRFWLLLHSHCLAFRCVCDLIWFDLLSLLRFFIWLDSSTPSLFIFCHLLLLLLLLLHHRHRFVINYSRNSLPEYVNMEWSPLWLVNRIHEHSVNSCNFGMPTWYWMVPSSSNAYFSTEHSSDCYRKRQWKRKKGKKFKMKLFVLYRLSMIKIQFVIQLICFAVWHFTTEPAVSIRFMARQKMIAERNGPSMGIICCVYSFGSHRICSSSLDHWTFMCSWYSINSCNVKVSIFCRKIWTFEMLPVAGIKIEPIKLSTLVNPFRRAFLSQY